MKTTREFVRPSDNVTARVDGLEQQYGWSIVSASDDTLAVAYRSDIQLHFRPSSFAPDPTCPSNSPISLAYIGDAQQRHPRPLTTTKRFLLQLLRAHLQCIPQADTTISDLLTLVQTSWTNASSIAEGVRRLTTAFIVDEKILGDERMAVTATMLIPAAPTPTKIRVVFDLGVSMGEHGVRGNVTVRAETVYGEPVSEGKMSEFLSGKVGTGLAGAETWVEAVLELQERLMSKWKKTVQ